MAYSDQDLCMCMCVFLCRCSHQCCALVQAVGVLAKRDVSSDTLTDIGREFSITLRFQSSLFMVNICTTNFPLLFPSPHLEVLISGSLPPPSLNDILYLHEIIEFVYCLLVLRKIRASDTLLTLQVLSVLPVADREILSHPPESVIEL